MKESVNVKACPHLQPLVEELRRRGVAVLARRRNWTEERGFVGWAIYYDTVFEPSLKEQAWLEPEIRYQVFGITAQYAGFFCDHCASLIAGANPDYDSGHIPAHTPFAPD
jgi:hypothetical protein